MWDYCEEDHVGGDSCCFLRPPGLENGDQGVQEYQEVQEDLEDIALNLGFLSLYLTPPPMLRTMEAVEEEVMLVKKDISKLKNVVILSSSNSLDQIIKLGKKAFFLSLQGLPEDADAKRLKELGISVVPLMYDVFGEEKSLFTLKKQEFVVDCIEQGLKIDLSHCNHNTARDVLRFLEELDAIDVKGAIIASHTGCYSVYNNPRNLPDDVLSGIAEMDGIVGISTITFHLDKSDNSIEPFLNHIQHAMLICGKDKVVVGSDRPYVKMSEEWWERRTRWMQEKLDPDGEMGIRHPDQALTLNTSQKMSVIRSELMRVLCGQRELANQITGNNLYRFIKQYM